ncbi:hypothetical protein BKI52_36235 [marine bacterium AO1-C]|nr:hypothetical protein BKI52_36235 [marine bacterium AO1-C]
MKKVIVAFIISSLLMGIRQAGVAQSKVMDQYIEEGLKNNLALTQKNLSWKKSRVALKEAKGLFMPQLSLEASYTRAGGGRKLDFPVGDLINPVYSTLNQLTGSDRFPTIANVNEQFLPNNFHETKLRFIQPLFNSDIYFNRQIKREMVAMQRNTEAVYRKELIKEIKVAYFQYLQTQEVLRIYEESRTLLKEILRVNKKLVKRHKITKDAIYGAEYQISQLDAQVAQTQQQAQASGAYFNFLLNRDLAENIEVDASMAKKITAPTLEQMAGMEGKREELLQIQNGINANNQSIKLNKFNAYPKVNLVVDAGYQGFGYQFNEDQRFWLMQVSLKWDLFKGFQNKAKIQQSQIEQDILQTRLKETQKQFLLQQRIARYAVLSAYQTIRTNEKAQRQINEQLKISRKRHTQGQIPYYELLQTQTNYTNNKIQLAVAQYNFLIKQAELERAVGVAK